LAIKLKKMPEKIIRPTDVFLVKLLDNKILIEMSSLLRQKKSSRVIISDNFTI
jgi:hypothetical protein